MDVGVVPEVMRVNDFLECMRFYKSF